MALVVADRVQETTTTTGTGTYTLAGAKDGFQSFAAVGNSNTTYYACTDGTDYEVGIGTYTLSGTTLARTTIIESSNSDAAVNWGAGEKDIFVTLPASKATVLDASGNATFTGDVTFEGATAGRNIVFDRSANQLRFSDNAKAVFGDGTDATIHWNGSALEFSSELGDVLIRGNNEIKLQAHTGENFFVGLSNGASTLYYDNSAKLATTTTGINVTGGIAVSGTVDGVDIATRDAVLTSTTTTANAAMPKSGGTFTGDVTFTGDAYNVTWDKSTDDFVFDQGARLDFGGGASITRSTGTAPSGGILSITGPTASDTYFNFSNNLIFYRGGTAAAQMMISGTTQRFHAYGNITVGGTVDGRDVATDGTKLDGIEAGANVGPSLAVAIALG